MMKNMNKTGIENLCNTIVEQSAKDYANAFMGKWVENISPQDTLSELDKFFSLRNSRPLVGRVNRNKGGTGHGYSTYHLPTSL